MRLLKSVNPANSLIKSCSTFIHSGTDNPFLWTQELVMQNVKNVVKAGVVKFRS